MFRAIGEGLGPKAAATLLGISVKTFESFRERIKIKLGVASSSELMVGAIAWRYGCYNLFSRMVLHRQTP